MKRACVSFLAWLVMLLSPLAPALAAAPAPSSAAGLSIAPPPKQRDLMAEGSDNHFWVAHVGKSPDGNYSQTSIVWRPRWSGNDEWSPMPTIGQRVVSIATSNDELLVVLQNGQWEIADGQDTRTGPTPPQWDVMLAVAADQDVVWAVVRGSMIPPASTQGSSAATAPASEPSTQSAEPRTQSAEPRLLVSQFADGKWIDAHPLPEGVSDDPAQLSLAVVKRQPMIAWRTTGGRINVSVLNQDEWTKPAVVEGPADLDNFKLLTINDRAVLWLAGAPPTSRPAAREAIDRAAGGISASGGAGEVLIGDDFRRRLPLHTPTTLPSNIGSQTLVKAFGNLRWIAYAGDQQIEQDFSMETFPESFPPATKMSVVANPKPPVIPLTPWIAGDAILVLAAGMAAARQRQLSAQVAPAAGEAKEAKPHLAPLGVRFVAGLVDLSPILAVVAIIHPANPTNPLASVDPTSLKYLTELAIVAYLLHTLVAELICGQSLGKMAFGLRVVGSEGGPPTAMAIVLRNLLRVIDVALMLPLVTVLISPLRQRIGDMVGGTVVVGPEGDGEEQG